jgi:hypothetical protein
VAVAALAALGLTGLVVTAQSKEAPRQEANIVELKSPPPPAPAVAEAAKPEPVEEPAPPPEPVAAVDQLRRGGHQAGAQGHRPHQRDRLHSGLPRHDAGFVGAHG